MGKKDSAAEAPTDTASTADLDAALDAMGYGGPAKGGGRPAGKVIGDADEEEDAVDDAEDEGAGGEESEAGDDDSEADPEAKGDEDAEDAEEKPEEEEEPAAKKKGDEDDDLDPATRRKLAVVQRAEKRHKEQVARDKAALEADVKAAEAKFDIIRKEWEPKIAAAQKLEAAMTSAKRDPVGLLLAAGLDEAELEAAARQAYLYSKGAKDPKTRDAALRMQREREQLDDVATLRKKLEALEQERATEKQQATLAQRREKFTDALVEAAKALHADAEDKTAADAAPVVMKQLAKNPAKTRERLFAIADELGRKTGEPPEADEVIAELERREREELEERGVDLATYLGASSAAGSRRPSRTLGRAGGGSKVNRVPKSDDDLAADIARELAEGRHLTGG